MVRGNYKEFARRAKTVFADSSAQEVEKREDAHAILRALNAIEVSLKADVDAMALLQKKGKHLG